MEKEMLRFNASHFFGFYVMIFAKLPVLPEWEFFNQMKKCQNCNFQNADEMRFCVECGKPLAASPMVINLQEGDSRKPMNAGTPSFGESQETRFGGQPNLQRVSPPKRGGGKILLAAGGVFALFFLLLTAGAAIIYFNWKPSKSVIIPADSPSPSPSRTVDKSTPKSAPTATPKSATPAAPPPETNSSPAASFENMRVDYNVTENGRFGMRIHIDFTTYNLKGVESDVVIRFQQEDDSYLLTNKGAYKTKNGEVAVSRALKPGFDTAVYNDLQFFMPYNEFRLSRGKYNLKMDVDLNYRNGEVIQHLNFYEFEYEEK